MLFVGISSGYTIENDQENVPKIRWVELYSDNNITYSFYPGQTVNLKIEIYNPVQNFTQINVNVYNNTGLLYTKFALTPGTTIDNNSRWYTGSFKLPSYNSPIGNWEIFISASNGTNESTFIKVRTDYIPSRNMTLGILAWDYGFLKYNPPNDTIKAYKNYTGADIWKLSITWGILEPSHGKFDDKYIDSILQFMDEAQKNGAKVQISITQQGWPIWVGETDNYDHGNRYYNYTINDNLKDAWIYLVKKLKDHPALDSYLIINEENYMTDPSIYLRANNKIISAIRSVDYSHRITIRPNPWQYNTTSYDRNIISGGNHDQNYNYGSYPTSSAWDWDHYANPVSNTSFLRMANLRVSPMLYNGVGAVGEIGFFKNKNDTFTDEEKLIAFKRALAISWEQGFDEFMLWGTGFAFDQPEVYFPLLKEYRDYIVNNISRKSRFNVRLLIDTGEGTLSNSLTEKNYELNMSKEPYHNIIRYLDEKGYSWIFTHSDATYLQPKIYDITINTSEIKNVPLERQNIIISERLKNITPRGVKYLWNGEVIFPAPKITVISPNNGEIWYKGTIRTIRWTSEEWPGPKVKIELYKGGSFNKTIAPNTDNDGYYNWTIQLTQPTGTDYKIKITSASNSAISDTSDNDFLISSDLRMKGDANDDSRITASDALLYLRYAVGQNIFPYHIGVSDDVTCDNVITAADALRVLKKAVGYNIDLTSCPSP